MIRVHFVYWNEICHHLCYHFIFIVLRQCSIINAFSQFRKKKLITKNLKAITVLAFLQYVPVWCMTTICNIQNIYIYIIIKYHSIWESLFSLLLCIMFIVIFLLFHFLFSNFTQCWLWLMIFRNNWLHFYV